MGNFVEFILIKDGVLLLPGAGVTLLNGVLFIDDEDADDAWGNSKL